MKCWRNILKYCMENVLINTEGSSWPRVMQQTKTIAILMTGLWLVVALFYYNVYPSRPSTIGINMFRRHNPEEHFLRSYNGTEDYLLNTAGCYIPNYAKTLKFVEAKDENLRCGIRAIFIDKDVYNIKFRINDKLLRKQYKGRMDYECYYRFASRSTVSGKEDTKVIYSQWTKFETGTTIRLKEEVVVVSCSTPFTNKLKPTVPFYEDAYMFVKKINVPQSSRERNQWNVLILGMDTMSRGRFLNTMTKTFSHFNQYGWLDYKGYHKVAYNTFPNLMSFLTGYKMSTVYKRCAKSMDKCNDDMIWSKFKKQGYVTAYGEDFLSLPDTFNPYHGFHTPPTDHYMRPLYLTGESRKGNLVCTKQVPSAVSALNYALDFVNMYKDNQFFGMFWLNSYSHNLDSLPTLLDTELSIFLDKLIDMDVLSKTFIFFLSDHGLRFGKMRLPVESYYEERLPMFFMRIPRDFKTLHKEAYFNLKLNENRLTTPYDLYGTFIKILQLSSGLETDEKSEACPKCMSLFEEKSEDRTCENAGVDEKWCSCHNLTSVNVQARGAAISIKLAVSHIQNLTKTIKTSGCTKCYMLQLKKVLRIHKYVDTILNKIKYVIAFEMSPGDIAYETSVEKDKDGFRILQPTFTISEYNTRGSCAVNRNDRAYCVCEKLTKNCH